MSDRRTLVLGQHIDLLSGFPFSSTQFSSKDGVPLIRIRDLTYNSQPDIFYTGEYANTYIVENGDILISMDGDFNIVRWSGGVGVLNQRVMKISERENSQLDLDFVFYWLTVFLPKLNAITAATTVKHLSVKDIAAALVDAPPKIIQRKIAEILNSLDCQIITTQRLVDKYKSIKQGMMIDLFSRGIDIVTGQLRPCAKNSPELYDETPLGLIPKAWEIFSLGDLSSIVSGITLGKDLSNVETISVPYLRVANVQDGYLDLSEVKFIDVPIADATKYLLQYGDVLMNEGGDFDKLGRGTVWRNEIDGCCHQNHVFRVRVNQCQLRPDFLAYWSASTYGKLYFVLNSKQSTNLASINSTQLKAFPVAKPNLAEQLAIEDRLKSVDAMIGKFRAEVDKLKLQKSGLMRDLLTGKVPVSA